MRNRGWGQNMEEKRYNRTEKFDLNREKTLNF